MQTYNIHVAKTHLSKLVDEAAQGESFIIAKAGKPLVKVQALAQPEPTVISRTGFLIGSATVPDAEQFNTLGDAEITALFGVDE